MTFMTIAELPNENLQHLQYGFFTTERGHSTDGAYLIDGAGSRNVNLYSVGHNKPLLVDSSDNVAQNIADCINEFPVSTDKHYTFYMTSNYAAQGTPVVKLIDENTFVNWQGKHDADIPPSLQERTELLQMLSQREISVLLADAVVLSHIPDWNVVLGGPSADAHPIILMDDVNRVCAYIAGSHKALQVGVITATIAQMVQQGADVNQIQVAIGPGLGPNSYEFGDDAPSYFAPLGLDPASFLTQVTNNKGETKFLVNAAELVKGACQQMGVRPEQVYDLGIDTMMYDLYETDEKGTKRRRDQVNFSELNQQGLLFFGARRQVQEDYGKADSSLHNTVGRHFAGVMLKR